MMAEPFVVSRTRIGRALAVARAPRFTIGVRIAARGYAIVLATNTNVRSSAGLKSTWERLVKFDDGIPCSCPPAEAEDPPCVIFRALNKDQVEDDDLKSWVKLGVPSAKPTNCKHWGLSVWMCVEAVEHARDVVPSMKDRYIAKAELQVGDGKVMATPSRPQPLHCTFWYNTLVDLKPRFAEILEPIDD